MSFISPVTINVGRGREDKNVHKCRHQGEDSLTTASTAFVMVGPSGVGSYHDRLWRVSPNSSQLVEGGTNGPYFMLGSGENEFIFHVEDFDADFVMRAAVLLITLLVGEEQTIGMLRATENLVETDQGERVAPFWEIADDVLRSLAKRLAPICRVGIVRLESTSIFSPEVVEALQNLGFDVSTYENIDTASANHHE